MSALTTIKANQSLDANPRCDFRVTLRPDYEGNFDELFAENCFVHAEMMDDGCLWVGIYPSRDANDQNRTVVWIRAEKGKKLSINAFED